MKISGGPVIQIARAVSLMNLVSLMKNLQHRSRNLICSLILVIGIFLICPQGRAATISVSSPSPVSAGDTVTVEVDVSLAPGEGLYAFQMDLDFPSFLQADSVTELGYFNTDGCCFFPGITDNVGDSITFITDSLTGNDLMVNSGALFDVTFTATAPGTDSVTIDPTTVYLLSDSSGDQLSVDISPGTVTVNPAPEPSTALLLAGGAGLLACASRLRKNRSGDRRK